MPSSSHAKLAPRPHQVQTAKVARGKLHAALSAPRAVEARYRREILAIMGGIHNGVFAMVKEKLLPHLPGPPAPETRQDAQSDDWLARVRTAFRKVGDRVTDHLPDRVNPAFERMSKGIASNGEKADKLVGIQPRHTVGLQSLIDHSRAENLSYLQKAGRAYADDVRDVLEEPGNFQLPIDQLTALLHERADVNLSRANLIATTQTLQLNAGLARARHELAGVSQYTWSTSLDERVRPMHAELEGTTQSYDDPPVTNDDGDTNNPGEDYRCRCIAVPQIPDVDEEGDDEEPANDVEPEEGSLLGAGARAALGRLLRGGNPVSEPDDDEEDIGEEQAEPDEESDE